MAGLWFGSARSVFLVKIFSGVFICVGVVLCCVTKVTFLKDLGGGEICIR